MRKWANLEGLWSEGQGLLDSRRQHLSALSPLPSRPIKFLSYNIQAGLPSGSYADYVRNGIRQIVPAADRCHLDKIATTINKYDIVVLQEVDCGSIRSGFVNQLEYLAKAGGFGFAHQQLNRDIGRFGQFSNGLLSRFTPMSIENHRLPGLKGRGAIIARFGLPVGQEREGCSCDGEQSVVVVGLHLALGWRAREKQIAYVLERIAHEENVILMGDLNCCEASATETALGESGLRHVNFGMGTFPSWAPKKCIDHIWVSSSMEVRTVEVLPERLSDHLPLSAHVQLPGAPYLPDGRS
jgi:endonuclease/exonuclease/phosphatase family metal-dependent hydrolase